MQNTVGKAVSTVQSGWPVGWALAAIFSTVLFTLLPQDIAWHALFWVGLLPALLVFFIRYFVDDPPVFKAAKETIAASGLSQSPFEIFRPASLGQRF